MDKVTFNLGDLLNLVKYPSVTEKSVSLLNQNQQYTFVVDRSLTKTQIKFVIQKIFNVNVLDVNTMTLPSKTRRVGKFIGKRSKYKKAYVKLKEGDIITDLSN